MTDENFADTPISLAEVRADRAGSAKDWSPRDALLSALRQIDKGDIAPDTLIVCWSKTEPNGDGQSDYLNSSASLFASIGLLTRCIHRMNVNASE